MKGKHTIIFGPHAIIEMLKARRRRLIALYTLAHTPKSFARIKPYLPKKVPNIQYVSREILDRMAMTTDHAGVVALVSDFAYEKNIFDARSAPFILLLDGVQDVRNVGAILRSAYCIGVDGVVLCGKESAPLTPAAIKASAGLAEHMRIYRARSLKQAVLDLKKAGYGFYMAVLDGGEPALQVTYEAPMCLVIGNEAQGISKDIQSFGTRITLPQRGTDMSYNASVAAALLLFVLKHGTVFSTT